MAPGMKKNMQCENNLRLNSFKKQFTFRAHWTVFQGQRLKLINWQFIVLQSKS